MAVATGAAIAAGVTAAAGAASAASDRSQAKKGLKAQQEQSASNAAFLSKQSEKASGQATSLFESAGKNRMAGFGQALDILGQTIPQQLSTFQQGNVGAQETLLAGLPQIQNALLGLPTDMSGLQPRTIQFDPRFSQQQLPQFDTTGQALSRAAAPAELAAQQAGMSNFSAGGFGKKTRSQKNNSGFDFLSGMSNSISPL